MTTPMFSMDKNPVDTMWKAALPAAIDNLCAFVNSASFRKRPMFKAYERPTFRAQWNLSYESVATVKEWLEFFLLNQTWDGVLHVSNAYSDYVQVSYGFVPVESPNYYDDRYEYAITIDLVTYSASQLADRINASESADALVWYEVIDIIDALPRLPFVEYDKTLRQMVDAAR